MAKTRVAILISGRGSNMQALLNACAQPDFPAEVVHVIANVPGAGGLERAETMGIATSVIDHTQYPDREAFDQALSAKLTEVGAEIVCLAGFMRLLSKTFVETWYGKMLNVHPSLLPAFKGLGVHQAAIDAGVRFSGCTVHFVSPEMDDGPIIAQAAVPVLHGDTKADLAKRILREEHRVYPLALKLVAEGKAKIVGNVVEITDTPEPQTSLLNPAESG